MPRWPARALPVSDVFAGIEAGTLVCGGAIDAQRQRRPGSRASG